MSAVLKVLAVLAAIGMLALGGIWTAQANGWIGHATPSRGIATVGGLLAGLGVAPLYVIFTSGRRR